MTHVLAEEDKKENRTRRIKHKEAVAHAIEDRSTSLANWYRNHLHYPLTDQSSAAAANMDNLPMLKWLRENGCPWDERTCDAAASRGHLNVLQWARANGCPWNAREGGMKAAREGHLAILQWAHANGCPWDDWIRIGAAFGHLEILKWAHANGCPWDEVTWIYARESVKPWLRENGCPGSHE